MKRLLGLLLVSTAASCSRQMAQVLVELRLEGRAVE